MLDNADVCKIKTFVIFLSKLKFVPYEYSIQTGRFYPHHSRLGLWPCYLAFAVFMAQTVFVDMRLLQHILRLTSEQGETRMVDDFHLILWHINVAASATVVCIWYVTAFVGEGHAMCLVLNLLYNVPSCSQSDVGGKETVIKWPTNSAILHNFKMLRFLVEIIKRRMLGGLRRCYTVQDALAVNIHKAYIVTVCTILGVYWVEPRFKNLLISVLNENHHRYESLVVACSIQETWFLLYIALVSSMVMQMHVLYFGKVLQELKDMERKTLHPRR